MLVSDEPQENGPLGEELADAGTDQPLKGAEGSECESPAQIGGNRLGDRA